MAGILGNPKDLHQLLHLPTLPTPFPAKTISRNPNPKGLTQYILCKLSKKPFDRSSVQVPGPNQMIDPSSKKTARDVIVQKIDSMATRVLVVTRYLIVVLTWRDRRTLTFDRL